MLYDYSLRTERECIRDITERVRGAVGKSSVKGGICVVYCPHTTAAVMVNEGYDRDVPADLLLGLERAYPDRPEFRHCEGNSAAHLKAGVVGASETLIIENGQLVLGRWQAVFFCEFDGPRERKFYVKVYG